MLKNCTCEQSARLSQMQAIYKRKTKSTMKKLKLSIDQNCQIHNTAKPCHAHSFKAFMPEPRH